MKFPVPPRENKNFCLAPWTHTFISPQSERRLCCASREMPSFVQQYIDQNGGDMGSKSYNPKNLEEHWNSDYMKGIRLKMLSGQSVPECEVCQSQRLHIHTYKDYFNQSLFPRLFEEVEAHTTPDGATDWRPRSFDYRFSNLCSFKCRMCGEQLSSAWENEKRQTGMWSPQHQPWMVQEARDQITKFTEDVVEKEFDAAVERGDVEEIYWVGGEPTIWPKHWDTMEKIIARGDAHKVHVRYNSNLAIISWKGRHLFHDILPHFKSYQMCASIDATGKIGEWIRTGLEWEKWKENFNSALPYLPRRGPHSLAMDLTVTLPGLFGVRELLKHALELDVTMYVKIVYAFDPSVLLSPLSLPREILHPLLDELINDVRPLVNDKTFVLLETLEQLKLRPTFMEEYPDWKDGFVRGKNYLQDLARLRGDGTRGRLRLEDILAASPAALRWWEGAYL